jgi:3-methyladenine DNA glycosylase/8-oxoguanine DNA glycosylase
MFTYTGRLANVVRYMSAVSEYPARYQTTETRFDIASSMALQQFGYRDPTALKSPIAFHKVFVAADDCLQLHRIDKDADNKVTVSVSGEQSAQALDTWKAKMPIVDGLDSFEPKHRIITFLHRTFPHLRIVRVPWLFDCAVTAILQQRISTYLAFEQFRKIAVRWSPNSVLGTACPSAAQCAEIAVHDLQAMGIDLQRAQTLLMLAREERRKPFCNDTTSRAELRERLLSLRGIGPWTTDMILGFGAGDTDAVPLGDLHLPNLVCRMLAGEDSDNEQRMLELLEPYRGQRFRVIRLLWTGLFHPSTKHLFARRAAGRFSRGSNGE